MQLQRKIMTGLLFMGAMVHGNTVLYAQDSTLKSQGSAGQTGIVIKGVIKDAATGLPLPAINISVPDYAAALTDDSGRFSIKVPSLNVTLFAGAEGFQSKEIPLKGNNTVAASLYEENFISVYDNVQTPFRTKPLNQSVNASGTVNTISSWNRNTETPDGFLQGRVPGLLATMRSGTPNAGAYLNIRGYNSLYATSKPLIVVDGMIYDNTDYGNSLISGHYTNPLADIDIRDIENITVIKDGASLYATKAANGVILITTTHPSQLATKINFGVYGGVNFAPAALPVMKAADYRTFLSDVLKTRGWTDARIQAQPYMNDNTADPNYYRYHNNTNWQNEVLKNSAVNNYYLKVTGGDNIARYSLSMGYTSNAGITAKTDLTKYNVRFNADLNLSKRLTAVTNLAYTYYEQNLKDQGLALKTNPIYLALTKAPFLNKNDVDSKGLVSPNLADTDTFGVSNPAAVIENMLSTSKNYRFFGSISFKYQLTKSITLGTIGGLTVDKIREQVFIPKKGIANDTLNNAVADSRLQNQTKRLFSLFTDSYIDYDKVFKRVHHVYARAGFRFLNTSTEQDFALGYNSATDDFITVGTGVSTLRKTGGDIGKNAWTNAYIGADYSLSDKYFLSASMTVDGSSKFGSQLPKGSGGGFNTGGNNFAVLPSIGLSWLISSERFMSAMHAIDVLKLRATFSKTGNEDIGNYTGRQSYTSQNLLGTQGLVRSNVANPYLIWESNKKINLGLDISVWNERLSFSVDVFRNTTGNMITYESLPTASGFSYAITNGGAMRTTGIDMSINGRLVNTKSVKWDMGIVIAAYKNRITRLPGNSTVTSFGGASVITAVDNPANIFYGYKTSGVYATDAAAAADGFTRRQNDASYASFQGGDIRFTDLNGDKIIDDNDRQHIGNPNPDYTGAFTNKISWKSLTLEALFTFSKGNKVYNGVRAALESQADADNQLLSVVNRWRAPGQVTSIPKAAWGDPMGNSSFSDRWIEDGSFLRMKAISLSYTLPLKGTKSIKSVTLYITGNNLLTFTKYLGYDPEFYAAESILARGVDVGLEPQFKSLIGGVRIGL